MKPDQSSVWFAIGTRVAIIRKVYSEYSSIKSSDIGKIFTITSIDFGGRLHNKYICVVYIKNKEKEHRVTVEEIGLLNPNCEPEGEFVVCTSCGVTYPTTELKIIKHLGNIPACPACGILEPSQS